MLKQYQRTFGHALCAADACVVVAAWLVSYWVRFYLPFENVAILAPPKSFPDFTTYAGLCPLVAALWIAVLTRTGVYQATRLLGRRREAARVLRGHVSALLAFIAFAYFFKHAGTSRLVMIYFGVLGGASMLALHIGLRTALRSLRRRGFNLRRILAVGEGLGLEMLIARLDWFPELGLRVQGVVTRADSGATEIASKPVLGRYSDISDIIRMTGTDEVLISVPPAKSEDVDLLLDLLKDETLGIRVVPDMNHYAALGCQVDELDGIPIVRINDSPVMGWGAIVKRLTDIAFSAIGLLILSPVLLAIALGVKLTSRGPIFYVQERMGLDGQGFNMFKFRTMRVDAESSSGAVWAKRGDDRCTALGAFLRKTSLDELPQFWNVLRGDMSLVGPRPERPQFVHKFRSEIPNYMLRHKVRTGITGWAQVNGWRGNTSLARRIECDLYYIRNWSYGFDLKILVMTLWKGFVHNNAY